MPSLPSSNTWQSIPSNLPPFQHPTALRLAPSHMKPTTARSSRAASWKTAFSGSWHDISVYFCWFIGEIWGIYALWMQQMSIEIWGKYLLAYPIAQSGLGRNNWTNRIPRGYPGYQWWMALFHMKSMGNLWEIYGKSTEIKDINQVKWNMLNGQHLVAPSLDCSETSPRQMM